jgi:hypothetical protein
MAKGRRYFQYRVTEVSGSMVGRIEVGALTLDWWQGKTHTYTIYDIPKAEETGSYSVRSEGECTPEQYESLAAQRAARELPIAGQEES